MAESIDKDIIFISYEREEENVARFVLQLKQDLEAESFSVWLDQERRPPTSSAQCTSRSSDDDWHKVIATKLRECSFLIPVITRKYTSSQYCMDELCTADDKDKMIFPIMYDDPGLIDFQGTELGRSLKFIISGINWTMFRPGRDDYGESLSKLIQGLKAASKSKTSLSNVENSEHIGPSCTKPIKVITGIQYPAKITTGCNGEIVVASSLKHKVHVYGPDFELVRTIGSMGFGDGQFAAPCGVAVDEHNHVYVASATKLDIFTMEGKFLKSQGSHGVSPLQFTNPTGIAFGKKEQIYVVDQMNHRVQVLDHDLNFISQFSKASSDLSLSRPQGIAVNSEGRVYVADWNSSIQVFDHDGTFLFKFGEFGPLDKLVPGNVRSPMDVAIDGQDNVYVGNIVGTIPIFDKNGTFLNEAGVHSSKKGQFKTISGLHIDRNGYLYVCQGHSHRIEIFDGCVPTPTKSKGESECNLGESKLPSTEET